MTVLERCRDMYGGLCLCTVKSVPIAYFNLFLFNENQGYKWWGDSLTLVSYCYFPWYYFISTRMQVYMWNNLKSVFELIKMRVQWRRYNWIQCLRYGVYSWTLHDMEESKFCQVCVRLQRAFLLLVFFMPCSIPTRGCCDAHVIINLIECRCRICGKTDSSSLVSHYRLLWWKWNP